MDGLEYDTNRWELSWVGNSPRRSPTPPRPPESTDELKEDEDHDDGDNDHHEEDEDEDDVDDQDIHKRLPSLHLRARCIKCENVGVVYCKASSASSYPDPRHLRVLCYASRCAKTGIVAVVVYPTRCRRDA